ncbi:MAG: hypothetical protein RIT25_1836 [Planctomycetota bacterium]
MALMRRLRWRLEYALGRGAIGLAAFVPEWLGYGAAALAGRLYHRCSPRRRRAALHMLRNAWPGRPDRELHRIAARATGNIFKVPVDMARITRLLASGGDIRSVVEHEEFERLLPKPPFLGLTAHLGSWEMAAVAMATLTHEAHGVARAFRNPLLQQWLLDNRRRGGLHIHSRRGGIRGMTAALERGAVGLQVVDQNQRKRGVFVPFFGELASSERAAVTLALRLQLPVVVGACVRVGSGFRFRLLATPPFRIADTGDQEADVRNAMMEVNRRLEQHIRDHADQYLWIHERYRTKPQPEHEHDDD